VPGTEAFGNVEKGGRHFVSDVSCGGGPHHRVLANGHRHSLRPLVAANEKEARRATIARASAFGKAMADFNACCVAATSAASG
jgi:hypothetical protein